MNNYTITIKSRNRVSGSDSDFKIKFDHVFPNDKKVFKCKVASFVIDTLYEDPLPVGESDGMHDEHGLPISSMFLTADFPFINMHSNFMGSPAVALFNLRSWEMDNSFEFLIGNINHQEIRFRFLSFDNDEQALFNNSNILRHYSVIVLNAEALD